MTDDITPQRPLFPDSVDPTQQVSSKTLAQALTHRALEGILQERPPTEVISDLSAATAVMASRGMDRTTFIQAMIRVWDKWAHNPNEPLPSKAGDFNG